MKLLIVEDDIHTMDAILDSINWLTIGIEQPFIAYNVTQAKKILENKTIDIVVSDIEMSQGSGLDLLGWIRQQRMDTEFILLTCHEKFEYAASAIKFGVAEYLTKPYDPEILEITLKKTISKITTNRHLIESSRYEEWVLHNNQQEQLFFWLRLFSGIIKKEREWIRREIEARKLPIDAEKKYHLLVTRITDYDLNRSDSERDQLIINLEKVQIDNLFNQNINSRIVHRYSENGLWLFAAIDDLSDCVLVQRCNLMVASCSEEYKVKATCCIGTSCNIEMLPEKAAQLEKLVQQSVLYYGLCFTEDEAVCSTSDESQVLDIEKLSGFLKQRDKVGLLNYIKTMLQRRIDNKTLSERYLYLVKQEILQSTYSFLLQAGIQATRLFYDETSITLLNNASQSAIDILRWANYLFERSFSYEEEIAKTNSLIQRINNYIHDHYQENIGRNELAEVFFLAPDYLGKLYRRKTGKNLHDYIGEYRIERAKDLLRNPELRVSDVAGEVGIDNFSYFSTLFRKYTGYSPNEYRKKVQYGLYPLDKTNQMSRN
jgi:two-component system, response regulator YesN